MKLKSRARSSAQVVVEDAGGILCVTVSGVVGLVDCIAALQVVRTKLAASAAGVVLVDARAAAFILTQADYIELARAMLWQPLQQPMAFVGGEWLMRVSSAHENLMHRRGFRHRFFATPQDALRWIGRLRRAPRAAGLFD